MKNAVQEPLPWKVQVERGALVCPMTRKALTLREDGMALVADRDIIYPILEGRVPVLLNDRGRIEEYLANSAMVREYGDACAGDSGAGTKGFRGWLEDRIKDDYRSTASRKAFEAAFRSPDSGNLFLSIGGGPMRDHPAFVNLNLGAFPNVDLIADAHHLPYADRSVDAIYCSAVMEHLYDPVQAVREMHRVLKPGRQAYVRSPFLQPYHGYPHHYQNFTLTGHIRIFEANGFAVEESGTDVGPTYALIHMFEFYMRLYHPVVWCKPIRFAWNLIAHGGLKRLDRRLVERPDAHLVASTTFLRAVKK